MPVEFRLQTPMITKRRVPKTIAAIAITFVSATKHFGFRSSLILAADTTQRLLRNLTTGPICRSEPGTTLLTFSVYPDLTRIWYHLARKHLGPDPRIVIVDCCGLLQKALFPEAQVIRFWNFSHSRKIDYFIRYVINTRHVWLCDDDVMFVNPEVSERAHRLLSQGQVAAVSLAPRGWSLTVDGREERGMGSYCLLFDREVFVSEGLSFSPVKTEDIKA